MRRGVRFTPPELAAKLVHGVLSRFQGEGPPAVLDPACGDGGLLLAAQAAGARRLHGIEIDPELARKARERVGSARILTGDALDPGRAWPAGTAIVANPPWVSYSGRQSAGGSDRRGPGGWPSLHGAFLERIAMHVAEEGTRAGVLLPASVCEGETYGLLRCRVTSRAALAAPPLELGESAFPGVTEPAVLLELEARPRKGPGTEAAWSTLDTGARAVLESLVPFPRLPSAAFGDPGVHTGNAARELIQRDGPNGLPGVREGRDLSLYQLEPPRLGLDVNLPRTEGRRFRIAPLERYHAIPVLLRQTANRPIAALHTRPTYFRNSLLACIPPPELDPAFVVGVLNSPVVAEWHRLSFLDARQRTFPQVKVAHLRSVPFPFVDRRANPTTHDRIAQLVRRQQDAPDDALVAEIEGLVAAAYA